MYFKFKILYNYIKLLKGAKTIMIDNKEALEAILIRFNLKEKPIKKDIVTIQGVTYYLFKLRRMKRIELIPLVIQFRDEVSQTKPLKEHPIYDMKDYEIKSSKSGRDWLVELIDDFINQEYDSYITRLRDAFIAAPKEIKPIIKRMYDAAIQ